MTFIGDLNISTIVKLHYIHSDYRPMPHLDVYDENVVDNDEYDVISADARAAAEREMRKRDRQEALTQGRMRPGLLYGKL